MATETLRPDGTGSEESIETFKLDTEAGHYHWEAVDEETADDISTYVRSGAVAYERDLYSLPASSGSGTINSVKIYFRCVSALSKSTGLAKPSLKSNSTVTDGTEVAAATYANWTTYSQQWNTNPADSGAWEWADIDALQIGVSLKEGVAGADTVCTQVYVEVDYTPAAVTHEGAATLSGVGTLAGIGRGIFIGKATLSGTGTLATIGSFLRYGKATLSGTGTLATIGQRICYGIATLTGIGTLAGIGRGIFIGKSTLSGTGSLSAIGRRIFYGVSALAGSGTLAGKAVLTVVAGAVLAGVGTLVVRVILQPISNTGLRAMKQGESEREERKIFGQEQYTGGGWW